MTNKTTMPGPYWYEVISEDGLKVEIHKTDEAAVDAALDMGGVVEINHLITTDQAEAYKDACVREALERVSREVHNVLHPTNPREDWTQYAYIREEAAHDAESTIRALIPKEPS